MPTNAAFSLFEVIISLLLVTIAVLSMMMLMPMGIKAQQMARAQLFASVKANELIEGFSQSMQDFKQSNISYISPYATPTAADLENLHIFNSLGQFDLERVVVNSNQGNYPVPPQIARRLDSPGDGIQRILDGGGQVYYMDPYPTRGASAGQRALGTNRDQSPELQRMVWGVLGYAQQNALPTEPMCPVPKEIWPFPPQAKSEVIPRRYMGALHVWYHQIAGKWTYDLYRTDVLLGSWQQFIWGRNKVQDLYQGNNWEWLAHCDGLKGMTTNSSPWIAGVEDFRRLVNGHYMRIHHQYSKLQGQLEMDKCDPPYVPPIYIDPNKGPIDSLGQKVEWPPAMPVLTAMPSPAIGLPNSRHRGTDILNEDHETHRFDWYDQIRVGLPSLQRRVMYRTAALALWAKVAGPLPISINSAPADNLNASTADPNVADLMVNLPATLNPLRQIITPPNPKDIHPTQVLALSYLAHAAMLVTGYKPPFVDDKGTIDPTDDVNLVVDESMPYKAREKPETYLWDPFHPTSQANPPAPPLSDADWATDQTMFERDLLGNRMTYRKLIGARLNPYPPPYADRGAYDDAGNQLYATTEIDKGDRTELHVTGYDATFANKDSEWARNAYETFMLWAMAYISENPYDLIVPKPLNRQTMVDKPLYAFHLFDNTGKAMRTLASPQFYHVIWGSRAAHFGAQWSFPDYIDSPLKYVDAKINGINPPPDTFQFGAPNPDAAVAHKTQENFSDWLNVLHGAPSGQRNVAVSPNHDKYWYNDPFSPAERCRQIVFWLVDWKQYEDAESAPSAPIDYSTLGRDWNTGRISGWFWQGKLLGNPEKDFVWANPNRDGTLLNRPASVVETTDYDIYDSRHPGIFYARAAEWAQGDTAQWSPWWTLGRWGADRNFNGTFDRGPIPSTVRLRATEVSRFNYYDPVAWTTIRN
ncbi:MAG: hypothetical protein H0W83_00790 [Planctomycetes bacterium]|nr:hypothetical protein [Planctomycetota bacterium]